MRIGGLPAVDAKPTIHVARAGSLTKSERERVESGVPFLSEIPYVNRLFKNVNPGGARRSIEVPLAIEGKSKIQGFTPTDVVLRPGDIVYVEGRTKTKKELPQDETSVFRKLQTKMFPNRAKAERILEANASEAVRIMNDSRVLVQSSGLSDQRQKPLLKIIDNDLAEIRTYLEKQSEKKESHRNRQNDKAKQLTKTYFIGDLIKLYPSVFKKIKVQNSLQFQETIPLSLRPNVSESATQQKRDGFTESDSKPITELIKSQVEPAAWNQENDTNAKVPAARMVFMPDKVSLVVSATRDIHSGIEDLLEKLRELSDVMIEVNSSVLVIPKSDIALAGLQDVLHSNNKTANDTINGRTIRKLQVLAGVRPGWAIHELESCMLFNGGDVSQGWSGFKAIDEGYMELQSYISPNLRAGQSLNTTIRIYNADGRHYEIDSKLLAAVFCLKNQTVLLC